MSPREFSRTIARLGMSQAGAGRYLGVSERTAYRYAKGETDMPPPKYCCCARSSPSTSSRSCRADTPGQLTPQLAGPQAALVGGLVVFGECGR
jgi:hypothetical protein